LVTIVEFADFECPYCAQVKPTLDELLRRYPNDLRLVFKHCPLEFHRRALPAAQLALLARARGGDRAFFAAADALFAQRGHLSDADLQEVGQRLKLARTEIDRVLTRAPYQAAIDADQAQAEELEVDGAPQFFVNGVRVVGARSLDEFVSVVESELVKAKALLKRPLERAGLYAEIVRTATGPVPESRPVSPPTAVSPTRGPASAPVEIQVFADFQCSFCRQGVATLGEVSKAYPGLIRVVWRNVPLSMHARARPAARAALEAFAQRGASGFWQMHDRLFAAQDREDGLSDAALLDHARQLGLDLARFRAALRDGRHDAAIDLDLAAAIRAGVDGTPAFLINGYYLSGARPMAVFRRIVDYARTHVQ
jgi:protein-disulfide isomerase